MRVFLDANVLFSASRSESNISKLTHLLLHKGTAVTSDLAHEEARRNIMLKRPDWSSEFDRFMKRMEIVGSVLFQLPIALDEKDLPILCAAVRAKCQYLVSGDKRDFGHLYDRAVEGVTVISLIRLAEILMDSPSQGR